MEITGNPVAEFGEIALLLALVVTTWAISSSVVGARVGSRRLIHSGIYAAYGAAALLSLASAIIFFAILANDYSIKYVHHYSDATMPWFYKVTSYWGGLDGSMMFWAWLLSLFSAVAIFVNRERHRELVPWVVAFLMLVLDFFLVLLIFEKRPFDLFLTEAPTAGKGLNPLLQNPYMATHPPSLYVGLVSSAVPFAFAMAALVTRNLDDSWLRSVRRWVLISWFFLSLGLTLGMLWAYEVLGWGGYWGWDPVENAGALAWFTSTAFLHSVMVQERRGMLKVWNVFLLITSFLLTMLATFLTRSGIVQSVHAFGSDPVLKWSFLAFIGFLSVLGYGLLIWRLPQLESRARLDSWLSREFAFLVNNWILLAAAVFILIATLFPTLSEWITGSRITIATPFYTQWMTPIGLALLFLTGVGPLIAWRRASKENLREQFTWPLLCGTVTVVVLAFIPAVHLDGGSLALERPLRWPLRATAAVFSENLQLPISLLCFGLCAFVLGTISQEFYRGTRVRQHHTKLDFFTSLVGLVQRNTRRYGGYIIHLGVVLMFVGFAGGSYKREMEATLQKNQEAHLGPYAVRFVDLVQQETSEKRVLAADVVILKDGKEVAHAAPAKWFYPNHEEEPVTHVEIQRGAKEDLYLVLNGYESENGVINLKVVLNPLVNWIWVGFLLLAIGTAIAYLPERALVIAAQGSKVVSALRGVTGLLVFVALGLGGLGAARAQAPPRGDTRPASGHAASNVVETRERTPDEKDLFHKIVCVCDGCKRELLADCTCSYAAKDRARISGWLGEGKAKAEIMKLVGEQAWAVPPNNWVAALAAYSALLLGMGGLVLAARRLTRPLPEAGPARAAAGHTATPSTTSAPSSASPSTSSPPASPAAGDDEYHAKLDDELSDLD